MLKCVICNKYIGHKHQNSKYCNRHQYKIKGSKPELTVSISMTELNSLLADRDKLRELERMHT